MPVLIDGGILAYIEHGAATGIIPDIERLMRAGFCTMPIVIDRPAANGYTCVAEDERLCSHEAFDRAFDGVAS